MIKGLYFKLNIDKEADKMIYDFFTQESKEVECNKIDLLFRLICAYKDEDWRKKYD